MDAGRRRSQLLHGQWRNCSKVKNTHQEHDVYLNFVQNLVRAILYAEGNKVNILDRPIPEIT